MRSALPWGLLLLPLIGGLVAARIAGHPLVALGGLHPGAADGFGSEVFVVRGHEVISFDGAANVRVVLADLPMNVSAIAWDPAERLCWASGFSLTCADLITSRRDDVLFDTPIRDIQIVCDGVVVLLESPARIVHRTTAGEQTSWPIHRDVAGLARGADCTTVGAWSATQTGDLALTNGSFRTDLESRDIDGAVRSDNGWLLRRGDTISKEGAKSLTTRRWSVAGARALVAGQPNAVLDEDGRLWLLP